MAETYRCVMEVLKCSEPVTVLKVASTVSELWATVSNSSELWHALLDSEGLEASDADSPTPKLCYQSLAINREKDTFAYIALEHSLHVYDCLKGKTVTKVEYPDVPFDHFCAAAFLSRTEVFVSGGYTETTSARILNFRSGTVRQLANMRQPRAYHSCLLLDKSVYVFGGFTDESTKTAERYDLQLQQWQPLPDMLDFHSSFNACYKARLVYLCGGHTPSCETFNIDSAEYHSLNCYLPVRNWTVSFFYLETLVTLIGSTACYFEGDRWTTKQVQHELIPWGNMSPVLCGDKVYVPMSFQNEVLEVDMHSMQGRELLHK